MFESILNRDVEDIIYNNLHSLCMKDAMDEMMTKSFKSENMEYVLLYIRHHFDVIDDEDFEEVIRNLYLDYVEKSKNYFVTICSMNCFCQHMYTEYLCELGRKYSYFYDLYVCDIYLISAGPFEYDTLDVARHIEHHITKVMDETVYTICPNKVDEEEIESWLNQLENGTILVA